MKNPEQRKEWLKNYRQTEKYKTRMREYRRKWMKTEKGRASIKKMRQKIRGFIASKKDVCVSCGCTERSKLNFHHINPATKWKKVGSCTSLITAERELKKCTVLCVECHKAVHRKGRKKERCPCCGTMVVPERINRV